MARIYGDISLGQRLAKLELAGLSLAEVAYERGMAMPPHAHRTPNVTLVLEGRLEERVAGGIYDVEPGCVVLKPAGTVHGNTFERRGARSFVIELQAAAPRAASGVLDRYRWLSPGAWSAAALRAYAAFRRATRDGVAPDRSDLDDSIAQLFAVLGAPSTTQPARAEGWERAACGLLDADGGALSIERVADELNTHRVHFARRFRSRVGCSPREYRQRRRISRALDLLSSTDTPLREVAQAAGYCDQSHLCRALRLRVGLTPGRYRELVGRSS
jgi:AraC family transcriptional regulator